MCLREAQAEEDGEGAGDRSALEELRVGRIVGDAGAGEAGEDAGDLRGRAAVAAGGGVAVVGGEDHEVAGEVEAIEEAAELAVDAGGGLGVFG
jgi:hypothetical protein